MPVLAWWEDTPYRFNIYSKSVLASNPHFSANIGAPTLKVKREWEAEKMRMAMQNNPWLYRKEPLYRPRSER